MPALGRPSTSPSRIGGGCCSTRPGTRSASRTCPDGRLVVMKVSRAQVLAYRVAVQGLHREANSVGDLAVLDIGVQEAMGQPAGYAFASRLADVANADPPVGPGHRLALAWTLRGAPHVHRRADLDALAGALWPLS